MAKKQYKGMPVITESELLGKDENVKTDTEKFQVSEEQILVEERNDIQRIRFTEPQTPEDRVSAEVITNADFSVQYVSRQFSSTVPQLRQLPSWSDDLTERFGVQVYDRMMRDSEVEAALSILSLASTSSPLKFIPAVVKDDPEYDGAKYIADFFTWMFESYTQSDIDEIRLSMVDSALKYGVATSELVYSVIDGGKYRNLIGVNQLKHNCVEEVNFLVDNWNNVIGMVPRLAGFHSTFLGQDGVISVDRLQSSQKREQILRRIVPRRKFIAFPWRSRCGDPRGQSALRPAYTFWWVKQQVIDNMMSWVEKYSQPSLIGIVSQNATVTCDFDESGQPIPGTEVSPTASLLEQLTSFKSASAIAVPHGTMIDTLKIPDTGRIFIELIGMCNREISRAILKQHLATSEGQFQSRAAADVHQDILSLMIILIKNWQANRIKKDLIRPLVALNFGEDNMHLCPQLDLGDNDGFPFNPFEISQLTGVGYLHESQLASIDRLLGLPQREVGTGFGMQDDTPSEGDLDDEQREGIQNTLTNGQDRFDRNVAQVNNMNAVMNRLNQTMMEMA